jgi:hypothetical protein
MTTTTWDVLQSLSAFWNGGKLVQTLKAQKVKLRMTVLEILDEKTNWDYIANIKRFLDRKQRGSNCDGSEDKDMCVTLLKTVREIRMASTNWVALQVSSAFEEQAQKLPPVWTDPCGREVHRQDEAVMMFHPPLASTGEYPAKTERYEFCCYFGGSCAVTAMQSKTFQV